MLGHTQLSDAEFLKRLEHFELSAEDFNHEAHLRLAWVQIKLLGVEEAKNRIAEQLLGFVAHLGATEKFNTTLTQASVEVVNHFMEKSKSNEFDEFILEFPHLKTQFLDLLQSHYSKEMLSSNLAKTEYVEPDLMAFR